MDIEKYTSAKLYSFFEWVFRLAIWNLLLVLITMTVMAIPYLTFYKIQDNNTLSSVEVVDQYDIKVVQKNGRETILNDVLYLNDEIYKEFVISEKLNGEVTTYTYQINMTKFILTYELEKKYDNIAFENSKLYGVVNKEKELIDDNIFSVENVEYKLDRDKYFVFQYENKEINFGECVETQSVLSSVFLTIAIVLGLFVFIPCFVTVFSMIKIFGEEKGSNAFLLFFDRLWDNFKALYKLELFMLPLICILVFSTYYYYSVITIGNALVSGAWVYILDLFTFAYNFLLVTLIIAVLWLLNLPMTLGYFRMKTKDIFKFTFSMTFKNILYTFIYLFSLLMPILICVIYPVILPMWFVFGISLPLYICYLTSRSKYRYLVRNIEEIQKEMIENTEIYRFTEQEKGDNHEIRN